MAAVESQVHQEIEQAVSKDSYIKQHDLETVVGQITDAMIEEAVKLKIADPKGFFTKVLHAVKDIIAKGDAVSEGKEDPLPAPAADDAENAGEEPIAAEEAEVVKAAGDAAAKEGEVKAEAQADEPATTKQDDEAAPAETAVKKEEHEDEEKDVEEAPKAQTAEDAPAQEDDAKAE